MIRKYTILGGLALTIITAFSPVYAGNTLQSNSSISEKELEKMTPEEKLTFKQRVQEDSIRQHQHWDSLSAQEKAALEQRIEANAALRKQLSERVGQ